MITIVAHNATAAYDEALWRMRVSGRHEETRNGPVITIPEPVMLSIYSPRERLITDKLRDANPFFHCMEFIWMMAGSKDALWLSQFNKNYINYSDDGKTVHAAYGHRWRKHFYDDQIKMAANLLKRNPLDRRIVIQMWDAYSDLGVEGKDFPCNTQIMLRVVDGALDFLVTNRSNDLVWGMLGANVVHMTMLQELLAQATGLEVGHYRVISNNLHIYKNMPRFQEIWDAHGPYEDIYAEEYRPYPLLSGGETLDDFIRDCENMVAGKMVMPMNTWLRNVGLPMYHIWFDRKDGQVYDINNIEADDWRIACQKWLSSTYRGSYPASP